MADEDDLKEFTEATEGVADITDTQGRFFSRALSTTSIEVLDVISEGPIEGLVSGEYDFQGAIGDIGYKTAAWKPFANAPNTQIPWLRSIYWNEVPVVSSDNKFNFQNIDVSFTPGTSNGAVLNSFNPQITVSRTLGERLRGAALDDKGNPIPNKDFIKTYRILNPECRGAIVNIRISSLQKTESAEDSDIIDARVVYQIDYKPIYTTTINETPAYIRGKRVEVIGRIQYGFIKSDRVNFYFTQDESRTKDLLGWEIRIMRITPDSLTSLERNITYIDSITEIYEDIYSYPNSAVVRSKFNSEYFSQVPTRAFDVKLLKVKVPTNYNPILKTYDESSPWDGTFKPNKEWTDNPAWCFYDLITNPNYGLGKYINPNFMDKWTLYEIAKYCDTLVADGYGGYEPRFSCNLVLNTRREAYEVINNLASIFLGMTYYAQGLIYAVQDCPKEPLVTFTNANVKDGDFTYSSSSRRVRHTVAIVRYNDKNDFYKPAVEYIEDVDAIRKYGVRELEIDAIGCTSRGQALRFGRWALLSETMETETVSFSAGLDALYLKPGDVFNIIDNNKKITRYAGRLSSIVNDAGRTYYVLDDNISLQDGVNYSFTIVTPSFRYDPTQIANFNSSLTDDMSRSCLQSGIFEASLNTVTTLNNKTALTSPTFVFDTTNYSIPDNAVWTIHMNSGIYDYSHSSQFLNPYLDRYRVVNIEEQEDGMEYKIVGLQYAQEKYLEIESGLNFDRYSMLSSTPAQPSYSYADVYNAGVAVQKVRISWTRGAFSIGTTHTAVFVGAYDTMEFDYDSPPTKNYLISYVAPDTLYYLYTPPSTGHYAYAIFGYNVNLNQYSNSCVSGDFWVTNLLPVKDIMISNLTLYSGIDTVLDTYRGVDRLYRQYYSQSPTFYWQLGTTGEGLPIDGKFRITIREPSNSNTPSNNIYLEATGLSIFGTEYTFTFDFDTNAKYAINGPHREYDIVVEVVDGAGNTSAGNTIDVVNRVYNEVWDNPIGYDILYVKNDRPTGIFLTPNSTAVDPPVVPDRFITKNNIDPSLVCRLIFSSGTLPQDIVGAYLYYSSGVFSGIHVTGVSPLPRPHNAQTIYVNQATYDATTQTFAMPLPNLNYIFRTGYIVLSPFDSFDYARIIKYGTGIMTGLYTTNPSLIFSTGMLNYISVGGTMSLYDSSNPESFSYNSKVYDKGYVIEVGSSFVVGGHIVVTQPN